MRNFMLSISLGLCLVLSAFLLQPSNPVSAAPTADANSTFGYVYGVSNLDNFKKALPRGSKQSDLDREVIEKTHLVYENGADNTLSRVAFQRMLWQAQMEGWTIMSVEEERLSAIIAHPKLLITDGARRPAKR